MGLQSIRDEMIEYLKERRRPLIEAAEKEGKPFFLGLPDSWYEGHLFRCALGHVSARILKSTRYGDCCLTCQAPVLLTSPSDREDPEDVKELTRMWWKKGWK
jgi:hypothetical protein